MKTLGGFFFVCGLLLLGAAFIAPASTGAGPWLISAGVLIVLGMILAAAGQRTNASYRR